MITRRNLMVGAGAAAVVAAVPGVVMASPVFPEIGSRVRLNAEDAHRWADFEDGAPENYESGTIVNYIEDFERIKIIRWDKKGPTIQTIFLVEQLMPL